jgi:ABC-type sugar transport system ATPase subunit
MSDLVLSGIRKSFGAVDVIHGVDLTVKDGEFVVFVGPSGCGKSTLLRIIAGLEAGTSGDILLDGRRVNDVPAADRGLAMVFQSYALYPHMSVRQNLSFGLENARMSKAEITQRVGEAARMLRIEELLERKPRQLSGGQRQRVAIGRAIVRRPGIFLLDEPLSNLDAELRVAMRGELASLHKRLAATMIYVTHDQVEAMTMADRIVVLRGGRVEQIGPPLELYNHPANRFVAGFLGAPRMNFLPARAGAREMVLADGTPVPVTVDLSRVGDQDLTLGIRPQHLRPTDGVGIPVQATLVEQLGSETVVHAKSDVLGTLVMAMPGQVGLRDGETVRLAFDPDAAHVFAADETALPRARGDRSSGPGPQPGSSP